MDFDAHYFFDLFSYYDFWQATLTVIALSVTSWIGGNILGLILALAKQSHFVVIRAIAKVYIWFFRSLPLLVLIILIYNLPQFFTSTSDLLSSPFISGLISLVLCESAFIAEIYRGGLMSVHKGQIEAAKSLNVNYAGIQRSIIIPQAIRIALPALANEFIVIVKLTSLVSVISLGEILLVGQRLYTQNFKVIETLLAVSCYYVFIVTIFDRVAHTLEKWMDIGSRKNRVISTQELALVHDQPTAPPIQARKSDTSKHRVTMALHGVSKNYGSKRVLREINLEIKKGEVISIIGPSGSGKTTLIRTMNGLEPLDAGEIILDDKLFLHPTANGRPDKNFYQQADKTGMVFQGFYLFPHKTALENIIFAPQYHHTGARDDILLQGLTLLKKVGLLEHAHKYPHQLSGGQQQRVAIARALAMKPSIMLFDEPTSALDPELVGEVLKVIEDLANEGMTMVIVTHEMSFAFKISDRIVFMEDGNVLAVGTPNEIHHSDNERLARFLHSQKHALNHLNL
ncbi:amino acid ABC transporter permease/ATP-binding protein [Affinibrenneria salicis]|uniref:Amino acid ABC transporter permease/ATP-binding protein n=1 Tax=Affinibrenneria salicis TaxID=2590031 RepID=A0A5J5G0N0_9GAMM|nr:amino acid ABC transporter permease/ATP-binding protein [Affinibrenneria salicis]KAA9000079.1 amino acid ABC transporter permease/ATP-binding protein [Affinibrenneria salicis]